MIALDGYSVAILPAILREGRAYALARDGGSFHVLREGTFPAESVCGLRLGAAVELPLEDVCANCATILSLEAAADDLNQRVTTAHERVACPKCGMAKGDQCRRVGARGWQAHPPLKHSHRERLRADGIALR